MVGAVRIHLGTGQSTTTHADHVLNLLGTGKLLPPKFGILSYMLDSVASGRVDDAIICPVSTQYDKVIEVEYGTLTLFFCLR